MPYTTLERVLRRSSALALAAALGFAGPAVAGSGGAGLGHGSKRHQRRVRDAVAGHVYGGDSVHMGDRILRQGMSGHDVRVLQDYLSIAGYATPITGYFGTQTLQNLIAFEQANSLPAGGVLNWDQSQALRQVVAAKISSQAPVPGEKAQLIDGLAIAPAAAPQVIKDVIAAANQIAFKPYIYGGGHGSWNSAGYDCSGSVSYALHGGGLLSSPEDSSSLESYGSSGRGQWITIWANAGHAFMYVAGLRFDTAAQGDTGGSRWTAQGRSHSGYVDVHPTGY